MNYNRIRSAGPLVVAATWKARCMQSEGGPNHMAGQKEKAATIQIPEAELRIEEITGSSSSIVRLGACPSNAKIGFSRTKNQ